MCRMIALAAQYAPMTATPATVVEIASPVTLRLTIERFPQLSDVFPCLGISRLQTLPLLTRALQAAQFAVILLTVLLV